MEKKVLYIEGTPEQENGDLRKAFNLLLSKELKGTMPRIVMGNGKRQTIDKFQMAPLQKGETRFLLLDSDCSLPKIESRKEYQKFNDSCPKRLIDSSPDNTFFMIQEVETWILSQPDALISMGLKRVNIPGGNITDIANPSDLLARIYKENGKEYHKVRDFVKVFPRLNTQALKVRFPDFESLITALKS